MTQLLERIEARLGKEHDEFVVAELLAKKAAYLGRVGDIEQARSIIQHVRQKFNDGRSGRVTCFLQVAEGVLLHNSFQSTAALDKLTRAELLAQAIREPDLIGICSVWKAFVDFDLSRFDSMSRSLLGIKDLDLEDDHAVQSRKAVILMTAAILLGERESAQSWFRVGHRHAVAEGDLACIDALLFNRAVFGLARQRISWCFGGIDPAWTKMIRAELESARNLQNLAGITTMQDHIDLCVARLNLIEGVGADRVASQSHLTSLERFSRKHVNELALHLDHLYECWLLGVLSLEDLKSQIKTLDWQQLSGLDPDERMVALTIYSRLASLFTADVGVDQRHQDLEESKEAYLAYEHGLRSAMGPWLSANKP